MARNSKFDDPETGARISPRAPSKNLNIYNLVVERRNSKGIPACAAKEVGSLGWLQQEMLPPDSEVAPNEAEEEMNVILILNTLFDLCSITKFGLESKTGLR